MALVLCNAVLASICVAILYYVTPVGRRWTLGKSEWHLPPGPRGIPLLGNLSEFLKARGSGNLLSWLERAATYGEMTTFHMGSQLWIVLNSNQAIDDILVKNSRVTNERPHMPVANGLVSKGRRSVVQREQEWTSSRRMMRPLLAGQALKTYGKYGDIESIHMLKAYLEEPKRWHRHHARYGASVLYRSVMGAPFKKSAAELDEYQTLTMQFLASILGSRVDFFPMLRFLPIQPWRRMWQAKGDMYDRVVLRWVSDGATIVQEGQAEASFVRDSLLPGNVQDKDPEHGGMFLANSIMAAGGDNLRMTINVFVMASVCFPTVFHRARLEIDSVCGSQDVLQHARLRLPSLDDVESMPYVQGFIKEVLRWRPVVPLNTPRELTEPLSYKGYRFPPGTNFLLNTPACCNGVESPDKLQPERWMGSSESGEPFFWFGAGRRNCVGYKLAQQALFLACARLIYCFDYTPAGPLDSKRLNPWSLDEPFPITSTCRSTAHAQLIRALPT